MTDTICAISTPAGIGGIAVIRISGPQAIAACSSIFRPFKESHRLEERKSHTLTFGQIILPQNSSDCICANPSTVESSNAHVEEEILDEVVVSIFRAPHSFTGEDVVEISCHGSLYIQQRILELLCNNNTNHTLPWSESYNKDFVVRLAEPGEFTRRAFAHGRFDLTQAEAVADLISAQSSASHRLAMQQMKGSISQKLLQLHDQLLQLTSLLELELDFSEEDVEFADRTRLINLAQEIDSEVTRLVSTFQQGQAIKNGIPVAIIGAPNVGKSTLLNALLKEDRAIVSDIQGTTRDLIEDTITLGGYLFRFIDTAGIRHTSDTIEQLGIERSHQAATRAQIILLITEPGIDYPVIDARPDQHVIHIINKVDLTPIHSNSTNPSTSSYPSTNSNSYKPSNSSTSNIPPLPATFDLPTSHISISAKHAIGIDALETALIDCVRHNDNQGEVILTNARHRDSLAKAHDALTRMMKGLSSGLSNEFVAMDLNDVISSLNQILGKEITSQSTLNNIFSHFCIGK